MSSNHARNIVMSVLALTGMGIIMVYSSTAVMAMRNGGSGVQYLVKHLFTVAVGIACMVIFSRIDYRKVRPLSYVLLGIALLLLILVFVPGIGGEANGARRWLRLWPTTFQPSELTKMVLVLFLAHYMDKNIHRMREFRYGIAIPVGIMLFFQAIIISQPDFGAVMSLGVLTVGLLILGGARLSHIGALVLLALPGIYLLVMTSAYRSKRFLCFLDPWKEPYGCGFQLVQSFIAFGNGSVFGLGLGGGRQKLYFLPEAHTDFIFSLIGEELGLAGVMLVLGLFVWIFIKGVQVSSRTTDPFSYFLTMGLSMLIGVQAIINFAVTTGLMPTKGLPLPFISFGGSALLINLSAAGILISISRRNAPGAPREPGHGSMKGRFDARHLPSARGGQGGYLYR